VIAQKNPVKASIMKAFTSDDKGMQNKRKRVQALTEPK
jgi:hypothetical protein